ncbi:MAG: AIPR family protein, partial [Elusimicrobiota bacterium]|nr:AIPR family protein [Elusimicrobiota bacterium]
SNIFWFLNNGITMIGDKVYADDDKAKWTITNLQIVNGQQTARMIHEAYINQKLKKDVKVMCRIYQLNNYNIISKITKATNLQSSISGRDLMSNDPKQIAIANCFEKMGYFYERQRGEIKTSKKYKSNISSKKLAQISLGILCKKPSLARKNMEDNFFNTNKNYYEIFDRNPKELLLAYLLYKYCNNLKNDKDELKYFGVLHIGRIIWEIKKNKFIEDIDKTIKAFEEQKNNLSSEYESALKVLKEIFKQERTSIENLGHYLSRIEVDDLIFRKLQEKTAYK